MSGDPVPVSRAQPSTVALAAIKRVDGPGSGLDADLVVLPLPRTGMSFGGFPNPSSAIAQPLADPSATYARFTLGT